MCLRRNDTINNTNYLKINGETSISKLERDGIDIIYGEVLVEEEENLANQTV